MIPPLPSLLVSRDPVAIPLCVLPERLQPREGDDVLTAKADDRPSQVLSLLTLRVERCGEDVVTVEAWFPWGGGPAEGCPGSHCYLTMESVAVLGGG